MDTTVSLPTRVLALDLSLTATGVWWGNPYNPGTSHGRGEIRTPDRKRGESDLDWNARRYAAFQARLCWTMREVGPELVVVEITTHAHQITTRARGTAQERRERTTRGLEFRAGLGLGRAIGWLDGFLASATMETPRFVTIEARDAKLRVAGSQAASKGAVAAKLGELWGWTTDGWRESEIDALCCAVAYLRTVEGDAKDAMFHALAASQDAGGRPARSSSNGSTIPRRRIGSRFS